MTIGKQIQTIKRRSYLVINLILVFIALSLTTCSDNNLGDQHKSLPEIQLNSFGFYSDSLDHLTYSVQKNETLSDILINLGVSANEIGNIVNRAKNILDVRKIVAGNIYHSFTDNDSTNTLVYFVYEKSPKRFVVFDLKDPIRVYESEKEVKSVEVQKSGVIDQSLYISLLDLNASPELAIKLSQIFAWQIDFYHLQKGDNFKVIYDRLFIDDKFFAVGKIKVAYFYHNKKEYYAIPFFQDSVVQYFDENGNSLRKAFLKAPLEFGRISSRYSKSRLHPVLKTRRPHLGVDYAAPVGTPIRATGDGVIAEIGYNSGAGRFVKVRHNSVYTTMYLHISRYAKGMKKGVQVKQGQVIGYVGSTGLATGPHVDYRFFMNGKAVDPLKVELPPSEPINKELKVEFEIQRDSLMNLLNNFDLASNQNHLQANQ